MKLQPSFNKASSENEKNQLASTLKGKWRLAWVFYNKIQKLGLKERRELRKQEILSLINQRNEARANKNFAEADQVRDKLLKMGILLEDGPQGTTWKHQ